jgi:predicted GNAT family acetyltransferase
MASAPNVTNNTAAGQFEIRTDAGVALLKYVPSGSSLDLVHTEVPAALEGQGYGAALAAAALDYARSQHLTVVPTCPFVQTYLRRHKEYADLVQSR